MLPALVVFGILWAHPGETTLQCGFNLTCPSEWVCVEAIKINPSKEDSSLKRGWQKSFLVRNYSCEPPDSGESVCSHCREMEERGGDCLINLSANVKVRCCTTHRCNEQRKEISKLNHDLFKFLPFSMFYAENEVISVFFLINLFALAYAYVMNSNHRKWARNDYNVFLDEKLLTTDEDPFLAIRKAGPELDGMLTTSELHTALLMLATKGTKTMPCVGRSDDSMHCAYVVNVVHPSAGHDKLVVEREFVTKYESMLWRMMEQGPGFFQIEPVELRDLFEEVCDIFDNESTLLELPSDIVVIGDLRGRYCDLLRWFQLYGYPPQRRYLFLGGIVDDANPDSIETITLITALKRVLPYDVFILRGATEYIRFQPKDRYPRLMCNALKKLMGRMFGAMPLAATINSRILAVNSGIHKEMRDLNAIKRIRRPLRGADAAMGRGILFNLPHSESSGFKAIQDSRGQFFGVEDVHNCISILGVSLIIRSRTPCINGCLMFAGNRMLTIWSNNGHGTNMASTLSISANMQISINSLSTSTTHPQSSCSTHFTA